MRGEGFGRKKKSLASDKLRCRWLLHMGVGMSNRKLDRNDSNSGEKSELENLKSSPSR